MRQSVRRDLCADDADALALEGSQSLGWSAGIGNEDVYLADLADEGGAHFAQLAGIGYHDHLFGLLEHLLVDQSLVGLQRGGSALGVEAGDADKDLVHDDVVEIGERGVAGERKRPRPGDDAAGEIGADAGLVAEFHANVDGVGDHLNLLAVAQAAADMGGGGAGGEAYGFVGLDELGGGEANAALFFGEALLAGQEGAVVTEGLVEQRLNQSGAAVGAANEAAAFKLGQVAPDAGSRGAGFGKNLFHCGRAVAEEELDDLFTAAIEGIGHIAPILYFRRVKKEGLNAFF